MDTKSITATLAGQVNEARRISGTTIQELSEATDIPYTTLHRKLNGRTDFTVPELHLIALRLGATSSSDWLRAALSEVAA